MKKLAKHCVPNVSTWLVLGLFLMAGTAGAVPFGPAQQSPGPPSQPAAGPSSILISYQGQLADTDGQPLTDDYPMRFALYDVPTDGTACWSETQTVSVSDGLFNVLLGSVSAIDSSCLRGDVYLGIKVGSDSEMTPRELLTSVPYAVRAGIEDGAVTTTKLHDDAVTSAKIDNGEVTSADIANNTISENDIADSFKARDADKLDGRDSSRFAESGHTHDDRYYTEGQSNNRFVNESGDTMNGDLTVAEGVLSVENYATHDVELARFENPHDSPDSDGYLSFYDSGDAVGRISYSKSDWTSKGTLRFSVNNGSGLHDGMQLGYRGHLNMLGHDVKGVDKLYVNEAYCDSSTTGEIIEANLQTGEEQEAAEIGRFTEGDLQCWMPKTNRLEKCRQANDTLIQSVANADGKPIVVGAEPVKVIGPVEAGDLLVSSDRSGYAMVNNDPAPGTVIAQALEDLEGEQGTIKAMIRKF